MLVVHNGRSAEFDPASLTYLAVPNRQDAPPLPAPVRPASTSVSADEIHMMTWRRGRALERLVLNVNNFCNLNCVYCYAEGGDYGGPHERMTAAIGRRAFERFYDLYETIATVQFFGGEPLLNWQVVDQLAEYGWTLADKRGRRRPVYTVITNGTVMSPSIIEMIRRYDMKVTVSLDGPPEINDRLRLSRAPGHAETSRQVEENIRWLKAETGQPGQIEGTYTRLHVREGCTINDILDWMVRDLQIGQLHMPINVLGQAGGSDEYALQPEDFAWVSDAYADAVTRTIRSLVNDPVGKVSILRSSLDIIEPLLAGHLDEAPFICPAGNGTIAVDSNGDVYPCFMFYRNAQFHLGSVTKRDHPTIQSQMQAQFLAAIRPQAIPGVEASWARSFLRGCAGGNYFKNGHHGTVSQQEVSLVERMVCAAVVELAHLKQDVQRWRYLPHALNLFKLYQMVPDA